MSGLTTRPIRVLIVDDHMVVRAGLRMLIESHGALAVVGEAASRGEALAAAARERPDIILLDLDLGGDYVADCIPGLLAASAGGRVLVLTGVRDAELHRQAVRLGARGVVRKENGAKVVLEAIEKVHAGEVWLERAAVARVLDEMRAARWAGETEAAKIATLTKREREVVTIVGEGLRNLQIAERLSISETTVRHHLTSIFDKLGVSDRLELVLYGYRYGLARPPR